LDIERRYRGTPVYFHKTKPLERSHVARLRGNKSMIHDASLGTQGGEAGMSCTSNKGTAPKESRAKMKPIDQLWHMGSIDNNDE
jgi:hypothetical protein